MASRPLTPVQLVDKSVSVEVRDRRALLEFESYGAAIRLSLSRHEALLLFQRLSNMIDELLKETSECEVVPFRHKGARE